MSQQKLEIMDDLLAEGKEIRDPAHFTELLNRRLPKGGEKKIKKNMMDKLISTLKELALEKGIQLIHKRGRGYIYQSVVQDRFRVFDKRVNDDDKDLLLIANCLFSLFPGTSMFDQFRSMVNNKILTNQKTGINNHLVTSIQLSNIHQDPGSKWITKIIKALRDQEAIDVEYVKPSSNGFIRTPRTLSPYIIRHHQSEWYLIAYDHFTPHADKTKTFKLSRIHSISVSAHKYFIDNTFSAESYFKHTIGIHHRHLHSPEKIQLKVLNDELFDNLIETPLHSTQQIIDEVKKVIEIKVFDTIELESLILSFGPNLKVMSPISIKNRIKDKVENILALYK